MRRLLTIGHSYVVAANRQLAHHMALAGGDRWQVTAVAPSHFRGDLRHIEVEPIPGERCALETVPVRFDRSPHLMWYGAAAGRILARDWHVVHCWEEPYTLAGAQVARAARSSKMVYASFQNIDKRYPWPISAFERMSMRRADGWIAFGETVSRTLDPRPGYRDKPHRVIPPGVDMAAFRPDTGEGREVRRAIGWTDETPVVGYLGRFVAQKGIRDLCAALEGIAAPWRALFVGGGPLEPELRRFAAAHPGRVHVATGVPHGDVPRWLNAMTVLCAPSLTTPRWREQFGRMLIEAMACGVPVVASDSGEMPHVVGDAGRVLPEGSPEVWARGLESLLSEPATREMLAARGRARAEAEYAWPVVARRHLDFFDAVVEGAVR